MKEGKVLVGSGPTVYNKTAMLNTSSPEDCDLK